MFLVTIRDGFQLVARIPYLAVPKYYTVASEIATMDLLRSFRPPIPKVYRYSPELDNAAGAESILMEFVRGTKLSDVWFDQGNGKSFLSCASLVLISFPAGGSLYNAQDLEKVTRGPGIPP